MNGKNEFEKKKEERYQFIHDIDGIDEKAIERYERRKYGNEDPDAPKVSTALIEEYDKKEVEKLSKAADQLFDHMFKDKALLDEMDRIIKAKEETNKGKMH